MMQLVVYLHTLLQRQTPSGPQSRVQVDLPEGSSIAELMLLLEIDMDPEHLLLVVNGKVVEPEYRLQPGDEVHLVPAISGG
jgi:sulfur carrier protein ThiS